MSFSSLGLGQGLLNAVADAGYASPTPIQARAIPMVLSGRDLLAAAQTGTGKTAAFVLPMLQRLNNRQECGSTVKPHQVRALVVVPTRELAAQVAAAVRAYSRYLPLRSVVVFGGVGIGPQKDQLKRGTDVLIATPGRLLDHVNQKTVTLSGVEMLVLDEADRMLDMGFIRDIRRIIERLPAMRQNLLFSATFSDEIRRLARDLLNSHATIDVGSNNRPIDLVEQRVYSADKARKGALLAHLLNTRDWSQILVFVRTRHGADKLAAFLIKQGVQATMIHGNKSQSARIKSLGDFKAGRVRVLVATDIAARGLDIAELPVVVNHDLPQAPEDYVHRVGRTGRAGTAGEAISLVCADERGQLKDIVRLIGREIPASTVVGFEPLQPLAASRKDGAAPKVAPRIAASRRHLVNDGRRRHSGPPQKSSGHRAGKSRRAHKPTIQ